MALGIEYDRETCDRCGGNGRYPSSAWHGICLKCHGAGRMLTRNGKSSVKKFNAWASNNMPTRVADLQPGMRYRAHAGHRWMTVVRLERTWSGCVPVPPEGYWAIVSDEGGKLITMCGYRDDDLVERWPTDDELRAIAPKLGKGARLIEGA
jgi:hypothetical protein